MTENWNTLARPEQLSPENPDWQIWAINAGRGWGKTRAAAEFINEVAKSDIRIGIVGRSFQDAVWNMVEGDSGTLATASNRADIDYSRSQRMIRWPSGAVGYIFSAQEPESLLGAQFDVSWGDNAWGWPEADPYDSAYRLDAFSNLLISTRLGRQPKAVFTGCENPELPSSSPSYIRARSRDYGSGAYLKDATRDFSSKS